MALVFGLTALFFYCYTLFLYTAPNSKILWHVMSIILGFITLVYIGCLMIVILVDRSYTGALFFALISSVLAATTVFTWVSFGTAQSATQSSTVVREWWWTRDVR